MTYTLSMIEIEWEDLVEAEFLLYATSNQHELIKNLKWQLEQYPYIQITVWDDDNVYITNNYSDYDRSRAPQKIKRFLHKCDSIIIMQKLTE